MIPDATGVGARALDCTWSRWMPRMFWVAILGLLFAGGGKPLAAQTQPSALFGDGQRAEHLGWGVLKCTPRGRRPRS